MTKKEIHYLDGTSEIVDLTAEEETQREIDEAKGNEELAKEQAKVDLKASAKEKLIAGEPLTEEEANTIVL
ncbi:hypothetical protein [uncultured Mediterranean phage uvMED]|nr:hypothetical protein [uncultured Mediterranean phage uvMED]